MFQNIKNFHALLMGNSLESCREDVRRMEKILKNMKIFPKICFDCYPQQEILNFLEKTKIEENDLLLIQFSGHGKIVGKSINGKVEILSSWVNPDNKNCLSINIDKILSKVKCKIILISDSCHSGNFGNFYEGKYPFFFIGSSSIIRTSTEYNIKSNKKSGVLVAFFEYIFSKINSIEELKNFKELNGDMFKKECDLFFKKYKIHKTPVIKEINLFI